MLDPLVPLRLLMRDRVLVSLTVGSLLACFCLVACLLACLLAWLLLLVAASGGDATSTTAPRHRVSDAE